MQARKNDLRQYAYKINIFFSKSHIPTGLYRMFFLNNESSRQYDYYSIRFMACFGHFLTHLPHSMHRL